MTSKNTTFTALNYTHYSLVFVILPSQILRKNLNQFPAPTIISTQVTSTLNSQLSSPEFFSSLYPFFSHLSTSFCFPYFFYLFSLTHVPFFFLFSSASSIGRSYSYG